MNIIKNELFNIKDECNFREFLFNKIYNNSIKMDELLAKYIFKYMSYNKESFHKLYNRYSQWNLLYNDQKIINDVINTFNYENYNQFINVLI